MAIVNTCVLAGNLTRDPELRYTPKGTPVMGGTVAVNRTWKTETGEKKEEVSFIDFRAFGRTAEVIAQYFRKGGNILLQGRLHQERWDDKQTSEKRSKVVLMAESFQFLNRNGGDEDGPSETAPSRPARPKAAADDLPPIEEDDVPF